MKGRLWISQSGISLVELMISFALSLLLMAALMSTYLSVKRHYQETGQKLLDVLEIEQISELFRDRIRVAGFTPCRGLSHLITYDHRLVKTRIIALDWHNSPPVMLQFSNMNAHYYPVSVPPLSNQLLLPSGICYEKGEDIMLADCFHAEIMRVKNCTKTSSGRVLLSFEDAIHFNYDIPFYVSEWEETRFYIAKNKAGHNVLWYGISREKEELSSLIQGFKVERNQSLIRVDFNLEGDLKIHLETRLRNP